MDYLNSIRDLIAEKDIIIKPIEGTRGSGISKISRNQNIDIEKLAEECIKNQCLIEECITGHQILQEINPSSLNTIRIVTFNVGRNVGILAAAVRFGIGNSVVDNIHNGSIWAHIDVKTGKVDTDATNVKGEKFSHHPTTGKKIGGIQIPLWNDCCNRCIEMHSGVDLPIIGWDVVVTANDAVEIIEGNHAPDADILQSPRNTGMRKEFEKVFKSFKNEMILRNKISEYPYGKM